MKITKENIIKYAQEYDKWYKGTDYEITEREIKKWLKTNRYLDRKKFIRIGCWKSPRTIRHYQKNRDVFVRKITKLSFSSKNEKERIECLLSLKNGLKGVRYPVASVILHFAFPNKYPIMDFRVIQSLGWKQPKNYDFIFWQRYCNKIRNISEKTGENIRTIDKALWQYSKEHQKKLANCRRLE